MLLPRTVRLNFGRCYAAGAEFLKNVPLTRRDGEKVKVDELKNKAIILYFSSGWCGHCRTFTPKLKKWYDEAAKDENIEIVWVSRDREAKHQIDYYNKALPNVPYIPFGDKHISEFLKKYGVETIPAVRLVNSSGEVIDHEVKSKIQDEGQVDARKLAKEFRSRV
ncbi:hypothetical protein, variant [Loa loa]|uniref:protein-disulfide reductase n=1 Tax=Loa loa TaxID=7209 RepID=A0A1S0UG77_LOALO|nr:hypothetical protein LOAG_02524 [Loa loa]XP_020305601.1 hypothetical protein, variant [Loa loa]EFO25967.1 hypothetical protein LOAG_02524 [Loa loa]EJD74700.1 hypothetical protein, variant [Loa loa]